MNEVLTGVMFAFWFIVVYFLSVKIFAATARTRAYWLSDAYTIRRMRRARTLTTDELSEHHGRQNAPRHLKK